MANLLPITGTDGFIALLNGASTPMTAEPCEQITQLPGGSLSYPVKQVFQVTLRTKKILDPRVKLTVYIGGVSVPRTQYKVLWGAGIILFRVPQSGTPVVTIDGAYMVTATATDVVEVEHVSDWSLNLTAAQIPGDQYGTEITPEYRGKFSGTWQFMRHASSSGLDLFYLMLLQSFFIFALYEELQSNRIWVIYGDLSASPQSAPVAGMSGGTVTGTLKYLPAFLNEVL